MYDNSYDQLIFGGKIEKLNTFFQKSPSQLITSFLFAHYLLLMNIPTPSSPQLPIQAEASHSENEESKLEKYSTADHLAEEKKKDKKDKNSLLKPFIKAARMFDEALQKNSEVLMKQMNPNSFWYIINAQYFTDAHMGRLQKDTAFQKSVDEIEAAMIRLPNRMRVPHKRENKQNKGEYKPEWRSDYLKDMAEGFVPWVSNFVHRQKKGPTLREVPVDKQQKMQKGDPQISSLGEDYSFLGSTITMVIKYLKRKMEKYQNFRLAVESYIQKYKYQNPPPEPTKIKTNIKYDIQQTTDENGNKHCTLISYEDQQDQQTKQINLTTDIILRSIALALPLDVVQTILEDMIERPCKGPPKDLNKKQLYCQSQDIANYVSTHHKTDDQWFDWLKTNNKIKQLSKETAPKKQQGMSSKRRLPTKQQDIICHICYSGQYQDNNLIVICSLCNISMHQGCAHIDQLPQDNWICRVCQIHGKEGANLPCYLCPVKGGAMLPSQLKAAYFDGSNEQFKNFLKQNKPWKKQPSKFATEIMRKTPDYPMLYNYLQKDTYCIEKPKLYNVWAHYNCIEILDECFYGVVEGQVWAEGMESIKKCKFSNRTCQICSSSEGVVAVCKDQKCQKGFHAQCARRIKMVSQEHVQDVVYFQVFCAEHRPLPIQQKWLMRRRKSRADIRKFASTILKVLGPERTSLKLPNLSSTLQTHKRSPIYHEPAVLKKKSKKGVQLYDETQNTNADDYNQREFYHAVLTNLKRLFEHFIEIKKDGKIITAYDQLIYTIQNQTDFWNQFYEPKQQAFAHFQRLRQNSASVKRSLLAFQVKIKQKSKQIYREENEESYYDEEIKNKNTTKKSTSKSKTQNIEIRPTRRSSRNKGQGSVNVSKLIVQVNVPKNQHISSVKVEFQDDNQKVPVKVEEQEKTAKSREPEQQIGDLATPLKVDGNWKKWHFDTPEKEHPSKRGRKSKQHKEDVKQENIINKNQEKSAKIEENPQIIRWTMTDKEQRQILSRLSKKKFIKKKLPDETILQQKKRRGRQPKAQSAQKRPQVKQQANSNFEDSIRRSGMLTRTAENLYCICQTPYDDSKPMLACEKCEQWFHFKCIGYLKGLTRAKTLRFVCQHCVALLSKTQRIKHLEQYSQLFKKNSSIIRTFSQWSSTSKSFTREL